MKARGHFLWILLVFVPVLWLAWPSSDKAGGGGDSQSSLEGRKHYPGDVRGADFDRTSDNPRRARSGRELSELTGVDRILADDAISNEQAALQLREIAMNPMNSVEDRLDALEHGFNLHAESFADFPQQKDLPSELASQYLHEIINHDDSPAVQIGGYMALMDHPDAEVADLAKEMLALELGDEGRESTREKLLVAAQTKLAKLTSEAGK